MKSTKGNVLLVQNSIKTTLIFRKTLIEKLIDNDKNVTILASNDCPDSLITLKSMGCKFINSGEFKGNVMQKFIFVLRYNLNLFIACFKSEYIYCFFVSTFLLCYLPLNVFYRKTLLSVEGLGSVFIKEGLLSNILRFAVKISPIRKFFCNEDEKSIVGRKSDLVIKGIGIELDRFSRTTRKQHRNVVNLIYVGRLVGDKGINDVFDVFGKLIKNSNHFKLYIIGSIYPGNPTSLTEDDIERAKIKFGDCIEFLGFTNNVSYWYSISDILLLPSKREGFPVCVMEASASGIPSVCYDVPGCSDAIEHGVNGVLCEKNTVESMYESICKLVINDKYKKFYDSTTKYALENFDRHSKDWLFLQQIPSLKREINDLS